MHVLVWIISGIIAGWLTGLIMRGRGYGLVRDFLLGLIGGLVGGWLAHLAGFRPASWLGEVVVAVIGGVVLVVVVRLARRV
jgi:uncharacterized membrane protein YeaQ/YmgE (transglycosylase-associated protein family)